LLDVAPTLLALAGIGAPPGLQGRDLFAKPAAAPEPVVIWNATTYPERYVGLRTPEWKYLRRVRPEDGVGAVAPRAAEELYDLRADPAETRNLAATDPARVATLRAELERRLAAMGQAPKRVAPEIDAATEDRLRALGYAK
jgi:arylsulfatase A-like enzyme